MNDQQQEHLTALAEIRSLMERSSRFISLSGLSGVFAGVFAIVGILYAYIHFGWSLSSDYTHFIRQTDGTLNEGLIKFFIVDAIAILILSLIFGSYFTIRKARKKGDTIWDATAKRLLINISIPLITGGLFCLVLWYHQLIYLIAPATLVFYGLALINASKYTFNDIRYLGIGEIILGLLAALFFSYGLIFWAFGFGFLHIVYGIYMYTKYEK